MNAPSLRARIDVIEALLKTADSRRDEKNNASVILRNGVFPKTYNENELVIEQMKTKAYSQEPLSFMELTRFNNWFALYPEKVAGKEVITTSREFPITIKGTREDIEKIIRGKEETTDSGLEALALEAELELMKF